MADLRGNQLAMIFQEPMTALNPVLTIGEQLCEPLIRHRGETPKPPGACHATDKRCRAGAGG
jgi:peptide/nickel transport system ATP-binding protein